MASKITNFVARWLLYGSEYRSQFSDSVSLEHLAILAKDSGAIGRLARLVRLPWRRKQPQAVYIGTKHTPNL